MALRSTSDCDSRKGSFARSSSTSRPATPSCPNQAFHIRNRLFGLQFHCELERETVAVWVREDADYVRGALGPEGGPRILADTERLYDDARPIWDRLIGNVISVMQ